MAAPRYERQAEGGVSPNTARVQPGVVTAASTGLGVAQAIGDTGNEFYRLAAIAERREQERDVLAVENAMNQYNEALIRHTSDPNDGIYNTNKLGLADGVTGRFEGFAAQTQQEIAKGLKNDRQRMAFARTSQKATQPYTKQVMGFESGQMDAYQKELTATTLNVQRDAVLANPFSDEQMESTYAQVAGALALQMKGSSPETIKAATDDYMSKVEADRIASVAQTDPVAAHEMAQSSTWLEGDMKQKLIGGTQNAVYKAQARDVAAQAFEMYGGEGEEYMGKEWIIAQGYEPEVEDAALSMYNSRYGVAQAKYSQLNRDLENAQTEHFNSVQRIYEEGGFRSQEEGDADLDSGRYTFRQWQYENTLRAGKVMSGSIDTQLKKVYGNAWNAASQEQKDRWRFDAVGTTPTIHANAVAFLNEQLQGGNLDQATINSYRDMNQITEQEKQSFTQAVEDYKGALGPVLKFENKKVGEILSTSDDGFLSAVMSKPQLAAKKAEYDGTVNQIMRSELPLDEKKSVIEEYTKTFLNTILSDAGMGPESKGFTGGDWGQVNQDRADRGLPPIPEKARPALIKAYEQVRSTVESGYVGLPARVSPQAVQDVFSNTQEIDASRFGPRNKYGTPVPGRGGSESSIPIRSAESYDDMSRAMLGRTYTMSSDYDRPRDGGKRTHMALDFAAPKGTLIRPMGVEGLIDPVVTKSVSNQTSSRSGAGNQVVISGKDILGNDVVQKYFHMNNVGVRQGDRITPGMSLGTVGNSGTSISKNGGDGSHLHYEVHVNGKRMNPLDYHKKLSAAMNGGNGDLLASSGNSSDAKPAPSATPTAPQATMATTPVKTATQAAQAKETEDTAKARAIIFGGNTQTVVPPAPTQGSLYYQPKKSAATTPVDIRPGA